MLTAIKGYFVSITGDTVGAENIFRKAESLKPDQQTSGQLHLFRTLNEIIKTRGAISNRIQDRAIIDLNWLDKLVSDSSQTKAKKQKEMSGYALMPDNSFMHPSGDYVQRVIYYNKRLRENFLILLGNLFYKSGDYVRAAACMPDFAGRMLIDIYLDGKQIAVMDNIQKGKNKEPLDEYLLTNTELKNWDMKSLTALKFLRKGDFRQANDLIKRTENNAIWYELEITTDAAEGPRIKTRMSQKDAVELLYKLSIPNKNTEKQAELYYQMGSIYYFTPGLSYADDIWGKSMWLTLNHDFDMESCLLNCVLPKADILNRIQDFYDNEYNNKKIAMQYFDKAESTSKNKELIAKCGLMRLLEKQRQFNKVYERSNWLISNIAFIEKQPKERHDDLMLQRDKYILQLEGQKKDALDFEKTSESTEFYKKYFNWCAPLRGMSSFNSAQSNIKK